MAALSLGRSQAANGAIRKRKLEDDRDAAKAKLDGIQRPVSADTRLTLSLAGSEPNEPRRVLRHVAVEPPERA